MKKLYILIISALFFSCDEAELVGDATQINTNEISGTPGFDWYQDAFNEYTPDQDILNQVSTEFESESEKLVIFVKPNCGCRGTQKDFPSLMKSIANSNIEYEFVEVFTANKESDNHPYQELFDIADLPAAYVIKNGEFKYSIFENYNSTNDEERLIENFLLEAVKN